MPGYFGNIPFFPGNITGKRPQLNQWMLSFLLPSVKSIWRFPQGISKKITQNERNAWNKVFSWWDDRILKAGVVIPLIFRNVP